MSLTVLAVITSRQMNIIAFYRVNHVRMDGQWKLPAIIARNLIS